MASYNYMMSADEVAQELHCSKSHAYKPVSYTHLDVYKRQL